ncbi:MAG: hypothetical protein ACREP9_15225, partial [Candidatus Dormibacteraceae bacterium]
TWALLGTWSGFLAVLWTRMGISTLALISYTPNGKGAIETRSVQSAIGAYAAHSVGEIGAQLAHPWRRHLPANAAGTAALHCPRNYQVLRSRAPLPTVL